MALNYSKGVAVGNNNVPQYNCPPPFVALATTGNTNISTSSVLVLNQATTAIEVAAVGSGGVVFKWITAASTNPSVFGISSVGATNGPNFDHNVPAATVRRFVVPIEVQTSQGYASLMLANRANGLYQQIAIVASGGPSSVMVTEY